MSRHESMCPTCGRRCVADGRDTLWHPPGCTAGEASRAVAQADVRWFAAHPFTTARWRALHLAEFSELTAAGIDTLTGRSWRAHVQAVPEGLERALCRDRAVVLRVVDVVEVAP